VVAAARVARGVRLGNLTRAVRGGVVGDDDLEVGGVFVVFREDDPVTQGELRYLKMGGGPFYLLHRPHVLVHYEAPLSAAEAVLHGAATVAPRGAPVAEVAAYAKRDLEDGQRLDGLGGFDCYGLIARADEARREGLLPVGLAGFCRLNRAIRKDEPIPADTVTFEEENAATTLRRRQDAHFAAATLSS
jgi:predicted homoserine dehydrogenase-like protein